MRASYSTAIAASLLAAALATPALAGGRGGGGGHGGDREPAGGAFMSSYPQPYSRGEPAYGPPRSVDFARPGYPYPPPEVTGSLYPVVPPSYGYYRR